MDGEREQSELNAKRWAEEHKVVYLDLRGAVGLETAIGILNTKDITTYKTVPLSRNGADLNFGVTTTTDLGRLQFIRQKFADYQCHFYVISEMSFNEMTESLDAVRLKQSASGTFEEVAQNIAAANGDEIFRIIAQQAYDMNASDIHIEPKTTDILVRYRIDGALHPIMSLPFDKYKIMLASIQTKSHMTWGGDRPQGGRLDLILVDGNGQEFTLNIRLESIPTLHGEEVIARLLILDTEYLVLDNMSLSEPERAKINEIIKQPHGMALAVGPTNSGKTSLLYAMINEINKPEIKVVTLEDPIEYELPNTSQIPVNADQKELFAEKLRAVLRQDPNVIMIGEIRDMDTAKTALQAALTGHLVLSTFHANTAAAAISRLMDMIGQNPLLPSSLRLVMAKRLVRKVCDACPEQYEPTPEETAEIRKELKGVPDTLYKPGDKITLVRGKGCDICHGFGYRGRMSLMEMLQMTPSMEKLISGGQLTATTSAITYQAVQDGMITLLQDGLLKALAGITTIEEVYRVVES